MIRKTEEDTTHDQKKQWWNRQEKESTCYFVSPSLLHFLVLLMYIFHLLTYFIMFCSNTRRIEEDPTNDQWWWSSQGTDTKTWLTETLAMTWWLYGLRHEDQHFLLCLPPVCMHCSALYSLIHSFNSFFKGLRRTAEDTTHDQKNRMMEQPGRGEQILFLFTTSSSFLCTFDS